MRPSLVPLPGGTLGRNWWDDVQQPTSQEAGETSVNTNPCNQFPCLPRPILLTEWPSGQLMPRDGPFPDDSRARTVTFIPFSLANRLTMIARPMQTISLSFAFLLLLRPERRMARNQQNDLPFILLLSCSGQQKQANDTVYARL